MTLVYVLFSSIIILLIPGKNMYTVPLDYYVYCLLTPVLCWPLTVVNIIFLAIRIRTIFPLDFVLPSDISMFSVL